MHGDYLGPGISDPCDIGEHHRGGLFSMPSERPTDKDQNEALEAALHLNLFGYTNGLEEHISEQNILPKPQPKLKGI